MRRQQTLQYLLTRVMKMRRIVLSVEKECYEHRSMKFTSVYNYRKKNHQSHVFYVKLILFTIVSHYRYIICFHITKRTIRKINKSNKSTRINAKREWKKIKDESKSFWMVNGCTKQSSMTTSDTLTRSEMKSLLLFSG